MNESKGSSRIYPDEVEHRILDTLDRESLRNGTLVAFGCIVYYNERYDPTCRRDWGEGPLELEPIGRLEVFAVSREEVTGAPGVYAVTPWPNRGDAEYYTDWDEAAARDEELNGWRN